MAEAYAIEGGAVDYLGRTTGGSSTREEDRFESQLKKLKDRELFNAYKRAVFDQFDIRDKVVVDVDCGFGLLSIFCAQAGAKRVYAVEASAFVNQAREIVEAAGQSRIITVLQGDVKDVTIEEPVDVIISDWVDPLLCSKSMLAHVLTARDRWLKDGGLIIPSHATLYIAPVALTAGYRNRVNIWSNVFEIDMSAVIPLAKAGLCSNASVEKIKIQDVIAVPQVVKLVDCYEVKAEELISFGSKFQFYLLSEAEIDLNATPPPPVTGTFHGFSLWTDVKFCAPTVLSDNETNLLSAAPDVQNIEWNQILLYVYNPVDVVQHDPLVGSVVITPIPNQDNMEITVKYELGGQSFVKTAVKR